MILKMFLVGRSNSKVACNKKAIILSGYFAKYCNRSALDFCLIMKVGTPIDFESG